MTNRHNYHRDLREDLRDQIDLVGELVRQVEGDLFCLLSRRDQRMGASYWTVYFGIQRISASVWRIPLLRESNVVDALIAYRIAVTSHALPGPANVHAGEEIEDALKLVCSKGNDLMKALDGYYFRRYAV